MTKGTPSIIQSEHDIEVAMESLTKSCPHLARAAQSTGPPPLRRWSAGFDGLVAIVVGQQLSTASATAILGRLAARVDPLDASGLMSAEAVDLLACGLSRGKLATLRALSLAVAEGTLDIDALQTMPAETVRRELTAIRGIGPWTADIYLLFCRGDADAFPAGDLALQVAVQHLLSLEARPKASELEALALRWQPWRSVAARLLWAYYAHVKAQSRAEVRRPRNGRGA